MRTDLFSTIFVAITICLLATVPTTPLEAATRIHDVIGLDARDECECQEYYDCIDSCAETFVGEGDFCYDTFDENSREFAGCTALADSNYESCLEECGPAPEGC